MYGSHSSNAINLLSWGCLGLPQCPVNFSRNPVFSSFSTSQAKKIYLLSLFQCLISRWFFCPISSFISFIFLTFILLSSLLCALSLMALSHCWSKERCYSIPILPIKFLCVFHFPSILSLPLQIEKQTWPWS